MNLVTRPVQKAGVDEGNPVPCRADAFLQVDRGAAFFVHDPHFDRILRQAQKLLDHCECSVGKSHLVWPVHLRLHHIDGTRHRIAAVARKIMQGDQRRDRCVHQAFEHLFAVPVQDCGVRHQMAHIAHQHQGAALQCHVAAVRGRVAAVFVQPPADRAPGLLDIRLQRARHQAKPVAIGQHLVFGIDAGHRILAIHDGRDGAFQQHVGQTGLIAAADGMGAVKHQFHMQPVVHQQHRIRGFGVPAIACELFTRHQRHIVDQQRAIVHMIAPGIGMTAAGDGKGIIQKHPHPCHNPRTAPPVISAFGWCTAHGIGAIKCIKQAAPTRIGGIQRVARIGDRHDKLRPRHQGNLWVCICGINLKIFPFGQQIADLLQKCLVGFMVMRPGAVRDMPGVDLRLQVVAPRQKHPVLGAKVMHQGRQPRPEGIRRNPGARKRPVFDKAGQSGVNLQPVQCSPVCHQCSPDWRVRASLCRPVPGCNRQPRMVPILRRV